MIYVKMVTAGALYMGKDGISDRGIFYESIAEDFDLIMNRYDLEQRLWLVFEELWPEAQGFETQGLEAPGSAGTAARALDVGCGTGWFSEGLRRHHPDAHLVSFDISRSLTRIAAARASSSPLCGDACRLPFDDGVFDLVVSSECIEHTPAPLTAVAEMARVTRPGGSVLLTSPNRLWYFSVVIANRLRLRPYEGLENWVWPQQAARLLEHSGLSIVARRGVHLWPFQLKPTRPLLRLIDRRLQILHSLMINFGIAAVKR